MVSKRLVDILLYTLKFRSDLIWRLQSIFAQNFSFFFLVHVDVDVELVVGGGRLTNK